MSHWDPNYGPPNRSQQMYDSLNYMDPSNVVYNTATNQYLNHNYFYDYSAQPSQNYNASQSFYNVQESGTSSFNCYGPNRGNPNQQLQYELPQGFRISSNYNVENSSSQQSMPAHVVDSKLTPLAEEFKPSVNYKSEERLKTSGAIRKNVNYTTKYGDKSVEQKHDAAGMNNLPTKEDYDKRHENKRESREGRKYNSYNNDYGSEKKFENRGRFGDRQPKQRNEFYNSRFNKFSKSEEQSKVLQEARQFLQYVNDKDDVVKPKVDNIKQNKSVVENASQKQFDKNNSHKNNSNFSRPNKNVQEAYYKNNSYYNKSGYDKYNKKRDNIPKKHFEDRSYKGSDDNVRKKNYDDKKHFEDGVEERYKKESRNNQEPAEVSNSSTYKKSYEERNGWQNKEKFAKKNNLHNQFTKEVDKKRSFGSGTFKKKLDAASQRERLEELIMRRMLECLVCCEKLRPTDRIWSCKQCYHILHLQCTKQWAQSSKLETGWRCPACQNVYQDVPNEFRCYCGKCSEPQLEAGSMPYSCGDVCARKGRSCLHICTLVCHPGPCPECTAMVARACGCGATSPMVRCSSSVPIVCQGICNKLLECGVHKCAKKCHIGDCDSCSDDVKQECYCGKVGRKVKCTAESNGITQYACGEICGKTLGCGNHKCELLCHDGDCNACVDAPDQVTTCPCGQTRLTEQRGSCLDPIACCNKICNKPLKCGQPCAPHLCKELCHKGPCPTCPLTTVVRCRCGHMDRELPCIGLTSKADDARCEKKCTKKRLCGKHKCNQLCCIEIEHICPLPCNRMLSCGQHRCEEVCHKGRCPPCWRTSFEELYCECGSSVLYPPVACGTRPPPCSQPCSRIRPCGHDVLHDCHTGPCPPCTLLCKRWCYGHHEQRSTIPCHQEDFSCGLPCGNDMPCGRHKCIQPCHGGACPVPCTQPCIELRSSCGHVCNQPCHELPCPDTLCKQMVKVSCQCGLRSSSRVCNDLAGEYQSIAMSQLASKMEEMQKGHSVDLTDIVSGQKKPGTLKTLECNDECRLVERNRRLAIGLQIRNPDLSSKLTPRYSDYMRNWAKKDQKFCQQIHEKLAELVQLAKQSKQKSRSYSFESMNREKRHFVHEYCEHFGCDSAAYDPEPNRNVVATAFRDKSWLPSYSLLQLIQRESGQRKVPGPQQLGKTTAGRTETVSLKLPGRIPRPATPPGEYVDYFNNPPE